MGPRTSQCRRVGRRRESGGVEGLAELERGSSGGEAVSGALHLTLLGSDHSLLCPAALPSSCVPLGRAQSLSGLSLTALHPARAERSPKSQPSRARLSLAGGCGFLPLAQQAAVRPWLGWQGWQLACGRWALVRGLSGQGLAASLAGAGDRCEGLPRGAKRAWGHGEPAQIPAPPTPHRGPVPP